MDRFERIWRGMTQSERIVAMSLLVGGVIGIANSTVWAVATCYIAHQRTRTRVAQFQAQSLRHLEENAFALPDLPDVDPFGDDTDEADDEVFPPDSLHIEKQ